MSRFVLECRAVRTQMLPPNNGSPDPQVLVTYLDERTVRWVLLIVVARASPTLAILSRALPFRPETLIKHRDRHQRL